MRLETNRLRLNGLIVASACAGFFVACATSTAPDGMYADSDSQGIQDVDLVMEPETTETLSETMEPDIVVLDEKTGPMEIKLVEGSGYNQLMLYNDTGDIQYEIMELEAPARLVLDINGLPVGESVHMSADGSSLVNGVRLGSHGQTGRIVLDLNQAVKYDVDNANGALTLTMRNDGAPIVAQTEGLGIAAEPESEINVVPVAATLPEVMEAEAAAIETVSIEQPLAPNTTGMPMLQALEIQQTGTGTNALIANMDSAGVYAFKQTAPNEYLLTLEGAAIGQDVQTAIVSPIGDGSIRSVRASQADKNIELRIITEVAEQLEVKAEGGTLLVASLNASDMPKDQIMAQADLAVDDTEEMPVEDGAEEAVEVSADDVAAVSGEDLPEEDELADLLGDSSRYSGRLISLDLQDTEIDNALRIIAEVSNLNIIASDDVTGKVTLRLIDVPWDQALDVILKTNGLDKVQEGNVVRIAPVEKLRAERESLRQAQQAEDELEPLRVQYIRVSYAKAAELQPLVETVLTERGTVTFDDRSNQLIVKDITKGLKNVSRLVQKLDLRTPQVLIETQIVEAQRSFVRDMGSELGFTYIRSPETGNALGYNFPNSMAIGGSAVDAGGDTAIDVSPTGSFFPANNAASAVSALFGSADGTKSLSMRLSAAEAEGRVRVVSRPSVAVTNNTPAVIKSVEKLRVKLPSGGVSVATGQGANSSGGGSVATEVIEIGIVLNVTAQASPDYYVLLDINAKSSTLGPQSDSVDEIPPEIERSATSTVLVSSGQTFAMGGIYRITEDSDISGVPFLKDVPVLGHFFRRTGVSDIDEELIFFITPRIIEGSFDDAAMKAIS